MHNLLLDPIIRVRLHDGSDRLSLTEVYAALAADKVADFPALRAHQRHAWHALLCQLGALACLRGGLPAPPRDAAKAHSSLRNYEGDRPNIRARAARPMASSARRVSAQRIKAPSPG